MRFFLAVIVAGFAPVFAAEECRAAGPRAGMELRYVVFIRPDPARKPLPLEERQRIMDAHMANIHHMADAGLLSAAGPMEDTPTTISGVFVLKAGSLAEAARIAAQDPTVVAGRNTVDVHPWWAPAGIGSAYFKWKRENPSAEDVMASHAFCIIKSAAGGAPLSQPDVAHERFLESLRSAGNLAAAGRIDGDPELLGIVIFKSASIDDGRKAFALDPAVDEGRVSVDYHVWWTADKVLPW